MRWSRTKGKRVVAVLVSSTEIHKPAVDTTASTLIRLPVGLKSYFRLSLRLIVSKRHVGHRIADERFQTR